MRALEAPHGAAPRSSHTPRRRAAPAAACCAHYAAAGQSAASLAAGAAQFAGARVAARPSARRSPPSRPALATASVVQEFAVSQVQVDEPLGEGSFGYVYLGTLRRDGQEPELVVLKKAKRGVENATEMQEAELYMNARVSRDTGGACAAFLGVVRVERGQSSGRLVSGLWLMWAYEGRYTLSSHLRSPTYPRALGAALYATPEALDEFEDPELAVAQTVMAQLLNALQQMHAAGLVHRDVKPLNLVLDEKARVFKLIDLGACADLRTGKNYAPDETILDPKYSPPEEFLMPIDQAPDLAGVPASEALALGASAWARYQPDRFDIYSAGIIFMQLAVPALRSDRGLKAFNEDIKTAGYDVYKWREAANLAPVQTAVLDANGGAGWELAAALLCARPVDWAEAPANGSGGRPSAAEALGARFFAERASLRSAGNKYSSVLAGQRALARLEAQMLEQTKAVSNTKFKVEQLAQSPAASRADIAVESNKLREQQKGLEGMFASFRAGVERALVDEARRTARDGMRVFDMARGVLTGSPVPPTTAAAQQAMADVRSELESEGAPEDTPAGGRRIVVPRDPLTAAAAATAALDALRAKAASEAAAAAAASASLAAAGPRPGRGDTTQSSAAPRADDGAGGAGPGERVGELADEISEVSARLVAMQERMNKLLSDNNKLLSELEDVSVPGTSPAPVASQSAEAADGEDAGGTATQGGRYQNSSSQRSEAAAAAAAALAAAAKVAEASAAVAAAADGRTRRRTVDD